MNAPATGAGAESRRGVRLRFLLVALTLLYLAAYYAFPGLYYVLGVNHYGEWFLDTFALLASNDAVSRGLDPYAPNPLDYFHRPHVYSHWWLYLRDLGLTRADVVWVGLAVVGSFLVAALSRLRPRSLGELAWYLAVIGSAPIVLAVERANNDLVIFVLLALLVPCLRSSRRLVRLLAPWLVAAAAMLKYYPAIAGLVLLAGTERKELRARLVLAALLLVLAAVSVAPDLVGFRAVAPKPAGLLSFGATAFFNNLGWTGLGPTLLCALTAVVIAVWAWRSRPLGDWLPVPAMDSDWLHLMLGASLLVGCFFTSLNFGYRWIFVAWLAPALWKLAHSLETPAPVRRLVRIEAWLLLIVLWWDPVCCIILNRFLEVLSSATIARLANACFLAEQPFDWALCVILLVLLTHFVRRQLAILRSS